MWLRNHARETLQIVPWQEADLVSLALTAEQCQQRVQWVDDGQRESGGAAISRCLQGCRQPWKTMGFILRWPLIRNLTELGYRVVAANRGRLKF